jgi:16S rRNA (guanine527-N7)-methyltransferase
MFHVKHEGDWTAELGIALDAAQVDQLEAYERLILDRAGPLGLVAKGDLGRIRERHVLDSLRAAHAIREPDLDAYDLGSGAGLPGVVVAIARPHLRVTLVETRQRRGAFLEIVIAEVGLSNASVFIGRAEKLSQPVDLCFARAFADADASWAIAEPLLRPGGRLVYFAGSSFDIRQNVPEGAVAEVAAPTGLASPGALVIMSRQ